MKRFDAEAIKARLLDRMRVKLNWALLSENGVISAIMDTFADSEAELARYAEYLLGEKKWTTAQNVSSLNSQVGLIGRKSHRMRSAISYVIVSHSDESGVTAFQTLDERSSILMIGRTTITSPRIQTRRILSDPSLLFRGPTIPRM